MSTSVSVKFRLYKLPIWEERNFVLDALGSYLDSMSIAKWPASGYQSIDAPVNVDLDVVIRVPLKDQLSFTETLDYTYCRIVYKDANNADHDYFYFIKDMTRSSNEVLTLYLRLDTLNTFASTWKNGLTARTRIIRQHEDRFLSGTHFAPTILMAKVDPIGEGLNPPLYVKSKTAIEQDYYDSRWCLRYEKDLEVEGWTTGPSATSIFLVLLPQQSGNTIDYYYGDNYPTISKNAIGYKIRTSENVDNITPRKSKQLVKEIQCPYCPFPMVAGVEAGTPPVNVIAIKDFIGEYTNANSSQIIISSAHIVGNHYSSKVCVDELFNMTAGSNGPAAKNVARKNKDPKLWNSEFHAFAYLYDVYEWAPQLERVIPALYGAQTQPTIYAVNYGIYYQQSADFVGDLAFRFFLNDGASYPGTYLYPENYDGLMTCNRNNDHVLYYDEYLEYMKLGYNYDKKTAVSSEIGAWTAFGAGLATTIIGIATQNPIVAAGGIIGSVAGLVNAIKTTVDSENALNRKQEEARRKGTNPQNVGDASLLYNYNENKLWKVEKTLSPAMEKMIDDLFYYYGYARGYYGVPNFTSRLYFNFVQCEAVFKEPVLPKAFLNDITAKLAEGITDFHDVDGAYELTQTKENFEISLFP